MFGTLFLFGDVVFRTEAFCLWSNFCHFPLKNRKRKNFFFEIPNWQIRENDNKCPDKRSKLVLCLILSVNRNILSPRFLYIVFSVSFTRTWIFIRGFLNVVRIHTLTKFSCFWLLYLEIKKIWSTGVFLHCKYRITVCRRTAERKCKQWVNNPI